MASGRGSFYAHGEIQRRNISEIPVFVKPMTG